MFAFEGVDAADVAGAGSACRGFDLVKIVRAGNDARRCNWRDAGFRRGRKSSRRKDLESIMVSEMHKHKV